MHKAGLMKTLTATFLVAGTCVGGGILALPVETGGIGFVPALVLLVLNWVFMMLTGLLYGEASLWMKEEGAHVVTISKHLLGRWGEVLAVGLYLFMGYASLVAYNSGGSVLVVNFIHAISSWGISKPEACVLFAIIFGSVLYLGTKLLGMINMVFVAGLCIAYFGMVTIGVGGLKHELLKHVSWREAYSVIPLMVTTFSFQMIVPSLSLYLKHDGKALKKAIVWGLVLPAVAYAVWLLVVLGIVPNEGVHGLQEAHREGVAATESLKHFTHSKYLTIFAEFFAFFAIVTSYFGISLGLYDFLADLIKVKKKGWGKCFLGMLVFLPTLYLTLIFPKAFIFALDITGGLGDSLLNGVMPVLMVWIGRYIIGYKSTSFQLFGGKKMLVCIFGFSLVIFFAQIANFFYK